MHDSWERAFAGAVNVNVRDDRDNPDNDDFINSAEYLGGGNPGSNVSKPALMVAAPVAVASNSAAVIGTGIDGESAIASDGANFLIVQCRDIGTAGVFGVLVSETGRVLNDFAISSDQCPQRPAVAFDGTNYLVVVTRATGLFGISVAPSGSAPNPLGKLVAANREFSRNATPSVAFDGENFLVAWREFSPAGGGIRAARVSKAGDALNEFSISTSQREDAPIVAFDGANYLVVWTQAPVGPADVAGARVSKLGGVLDSPAIPIAIGPNTQTASGVAFDGTNYLVVWDDVTQSGGATIRGRRVGQNGSLLDGAADTAGIEVSTSGFPSHSSSVAFSGSTFVVTWVVGASIPNIPAGIFATRISRNGVRIDSVAGDLGVPVSGRPAPTSSFVNPVVAAKGQSALIAWVNSESPRAILAAPVISP
jgi:hypothetical protein